MVKTIIIIIALQLWHSLNASGQDIKVSLLNNSRYCELSRLYYGVDNCIKVGSTSVSSEAIAHIIIQSDSLNISRRNDSIFCLRTKYQDVSCTLIVEDTVQKKELKKIRIYCSSQPFIFSLYPNYNSHVNTYLTVKSDMKRLYLSTYENECHEWARQYKIKTYQLLIKRNGSTIYQRDFKKNKIASREKRKIIKLLNKGDVLFANSIVLIYERSDLIISSYPLFAL